jgi:hypothetical protein
MDDRYHQHHPEYVIGLKRKVTNCTVETFEKTNFIINEKLLCHI